MKVLPESDSNVLTAECPLITKRNDKLLTCKFSLKSTDTEICIDGQFFKLGFPLQKTQQNVNGLLHGIHNVRVCNGVAFQRNLPKTFVTETFSEIHGQESVKIARSKSCKIFLPISGNCSTCKTCTDSFNQYNRRVSEINTDESINICAENEMEELPEPSTKRARVPLLDTTNTLNSLNTRTNTKSNRSETDMENAINLSLELNKESHTDMKDILENILKDGEGAQFRLLLESQLRNCDSQLEIHRRRWDPRVIRICLGLFIRSPRAYNDLKASGLLVLPSQRLLRYYKNIVKQKPDFNENNLDWMKTEASRRNISSFGHRGGILIDEMTVQDDLVITKKGDKWDIVGMVDMGRTNNSIKVLTDRQKKVEMATHALQFIFHGYTGFR